MGKATGVGAIVFGVIMILLGIGAYFSGEASSQTDQGRLAIGIVILLGLAMIYGGVDARQKAQEKERAASQPVQLAQPMQTVTTATTTAEIPPPPPDTVMTATCSSCGRAIQSDFRVCPFCGKPTARFCPKCGKQVQSEFVVCPFCGTSLRTG